MTYVIKYYNIFVQQQFSNQLDSRYETFEKDPREIYDK